jgi:hypothetical protein
MKTIVKSFLAIIYVVRSINWIKFMNLYDRKSNNVIVLSFIKGKYGNELLFWDFGYINAFINANRKFRLAISFSGFHNASIYWSPSKYYSSSADYSPDLIRIARNAEARKNKIFPSSNELLFLENKTYMYKYFDLHNISNPKTEYFKSINEVEDAELHFPLLLKGEHSSGSQDIYKFDDKNSLLNFLNTSGFCDRFGTILIQKLLNIRRDLRVTIVGNEVVLYYWRINKSDEWKPTASSFGGIISFSDYPHQWHNFFLSEFRKLNIPMAAFDIAWDNDDLSTEPVFLEVSSRFSPNPPFNTVDNISYSAWKKKLIGKNVYYKLQCDLIFQIAGKYLRSTENNLFV